MSSAIANDYLYTFSDGKLGDHVGIWWLTGLQDAQEPGQVVRLDADLVDWVAKANVGGTGTLLSVGPYAYTRARACEVFASVQGPAQPWFLVRGDGDEHTFSIATEPNGKRVWTAGEKGAPIRIEDFRPGGINQTFKFVPTPSE